MTNYRIVKDLKCSPTSVANWLSGKIPSGNKVNEIAVYFKTSTDYLLGKTDIKIAPSEDEANITMNQEAHELTDNEKDKLLELARFLTKTARKENNQLHL